MCEIALIYSLMSDLILHALIALWRRGCWEVG